jgi:DNA-binding CsgD family transcriptional regulator
MYERASVQNRSVLPAVLGWMAEGELAAGRFAAARDHTAEALERAEEIGWPEGPPWEIGFHAVALARLGLVAEAEVTARGILGPGADPVVGLDGAPARLALGIAALARGDVEESVTQLRILDDLKRGCGIREPRMCAHAADYLEALVTAGRLDEAAEVLGRLDEQAETSHGRGSLAIAARGHAMLAAARGDVDEAAEAAARSLELFADLPMPFERGRTLLVVGQIHRRRREKRLAREALLEAFEAFSGLDAVTWADRARAELDRVPDRRTAAELTATEERVARLAAEGLTNQEIAERAFLSPKTVEVNLTRVYRKLGVRRAALASRLGEGTSGEPTQP